jgi:hypothetical protein
MPQKAPPHDEWFKKYLDESFRQVHARLDQMELNREKRDLAVNLMDTTNKAETHAVKDQVVRLSDRVKRLEWMVQAAVWAVVAIGGLVTWSMNVWASVTSVFKA